MLNVCSVKEPTQSAKYKPVFKSSLRHYFLPWLSKYFRNIYVGIWQKLMKFLVCALIILVLLI